MPDTDIKINYYLRQQKSIERRMFCHLFSSVNRVFDLHRYRYIGMGAKYFADFLLFHREFGFKTMISIEADSENQEKYEFNKPLQCIKMKFGFSNQVLPKLDWISQIPSIVWLDYDSILDNSMMEDLETILSKLTSRSMFFLSFNSNWYEDKKNDIVKQTNIRQENFKNKLKNYFPLGLAKRDFSNMNKHKTQCIPINNTIDNAISLRPGMTYVQLIDFIYQDGAEMTTIGGIILDDNDAVKFNSLDFDHLDFVKKDRETDAYSLKIPPLTYKEAITIFEHLPCDDYSVINLPGLSKEHISQIAKVYRYYPFYLETSLFT